MTTAYWVSSARPSTKRGSTRAVTPAASDGMACRVTSAPSAKRYHRAVAEIAPADSMRKGVVQPVTPPSVRVTFGKYARLPTAVAPTNAIPVAGLVSASTTANWPPVTTSEYSPSPRQAAAPATGQALWPSTANRGSNDQARPGLSCGAARVIVPGTPRRWNERIGAVSAAARFSMSRRLVRPMPSVFRDISGRYTGADDPAGTPL